MFGEKLEQASRNVVLPLIPLATVLTSVPAFAQTAAPGQPSPFASLLPMAVMFGILWFLVLRPQMKKQKTHQEFVSKLQRGDEVLTSGGILGRIEGLTEMYITLEIAPGVRIKVLRSQIASPIPDPNKTAGQTNSNEAKS